MVNRISNTRREEKKTQHTPKLTQNFVAKPNCLFESNETLYKNFERAFTEIFMYCTVWTFSMSCMLGWPVCYVRVYSLVPVLAPCAWALTKQEWIITVLCIAALTVSINSGEHIEGSNAFYHIIILYINTSTHAHCALTITISQNLSVYTYIHVYMSCLHSQKAQPWIQIPGCLRGEYSTTMHKYHNRTNFNIFPNTFW